MSKPRAAAALDLDEIGYDDVLATFNKVLWECTKKLTRTDMAHARATLGIDQNSSGKTRAAVKTMLNDTALFSPKDNKKRAIDRIAPKLATGDDPLTALIATRLPDAEFLILSLQDFHEDGGVIAEDLLHKEREIRIMNDNLEVWLEDDEVIIAGRFLDLGPWFIGFSSDIVFPVLRSEAMAILCTLSMLTHGGPKDDSDSRAILHELLYSAKIHGLNLVMESLEPVIMALAFAIDTGALDFDKFSSMLEAITAHIPEIRRPDPLQKLLYSILGAAL